MLCSGCSMSEEFENEHTNVSPETNEQIRARRAQRRQRVDKMSRRSSLGGATRGPVGHVRKADRLISQVDPHGGYIKTYGGRLLTSAIFAFLSLFLLVDLITFGSDDILLMLLLGLTAFISIALPLRWFVEHRRLKEVFEGRGEGIGEEEVFVPGRRTDDDAESEVVFSLPEEEPRGVEEDAPSSVEWDAKW